MASRETYGRARSQTPLVSVALACALGAPATALANVGEIIGGTLQGAAKIIEESGKIAIASTQAKADVEIAKINAEASISMTKTAADTSKYLADSQKEISLAQTLAAYEINRTNQEHADRRLAMQLSELAAARRDAYELQRLERQQQFEYDMARLKIAQQQSEAMIALARETAKWELTKAGLSAGFTNSTNSGSRLTVTKTFGAGTTATASTTPPAAGAADAAGSGQAVAAARTAGATRTPNAARLASRLTVSRASRGPARGVTATGASAKLLARVSSARPAARLAFSSDGKVFELPPRGFTATPTTSTSADGTLTRALAGNGAARGSTVTMRQRLAAGTTIARVETASVRGRYEGMPHAPSARQLASEIPAAESIPASTGTHAGGASASTGGLAGDSRMPSSIRTASPFEVASP